MKKLLRILWILPLLLINLTGVQAATYQGDPNNNDDIDYIDTPGGSIDNETCDDKIDPSSKAMAQRMLTLLNETRLKQGKPELIMPAEMQCRAQISVNHVLDSIRDHTKANLAAKLAIRPGEDFTAEYGNFLDQLPTVVIDRALKTYPYKPYLPFDKKFTQVGIGYAFDYRIPNNPFYAAWIFILT